MSENQPTDSTTVLPPSGFTDFFVACLQQNRPDLEVEIVADLELRFSLGGDSGKPHQAFLDNAYTVYLNDPESRDEIIDQFIAGQLETLAKTSDDDIDSSKIVPVVKDRRWLDEVSASLSEKDADFELPLHDDYNSELQIIYAEDSEHNIRYLNNGNLEDLGCSREELQQHAVGNLKNLLSGKIEVMGGEGIYMVTAGGSYETSLLLIDTLWNDESPMEVNGNFVVAIPTRDMLLVTGSDDLAGIARIREIAGEMIQDNAYTLTTVLFTNPADHFEVFEG